MNCRAAERLISAERDGTLSPTERAALEAHVAGCATCRQARETLATAAASWRARDAAVATPDPERAWHDIRRQMRGGGAVARPVRARWWVRALWTGVPTLGAAALALVVWTRGRLPVVDPEVAAASWAQFVEVDGSTSAATVMIDDASGWVVVWAGEAEGTQS
jgi:predicted anti-sigma-YlaC factor YlaD